MRQAAADRDNLTRQESEEDSSDPGEDHPQADGWGRYSATSQYDPASLLQCLTESQEALQRRQQEEASAVRHVVAQRPTPPTLPWQWQAPWFLGPPPGPPPTLANYAAKSHDAPDDSHDDGDSIYTYYGSESDVSTCLSMPSLVGSGEGSMSPWECDEPSSPWECDEPSPEPEPHGPDKPDLVPVSQPEDETTLELPSLLCDKMATESHVVSQKHILKMEEEAISNFMGGNAHSTCGVICRVTDFDQGTRSVSLNPLLANLGDAHQAMTALAELDMESNPDVTNAGGISLQVQPVASIPRASAVNATTFAVLQDCRTELQEVPEFEDTVELVSGTVRPFQAELCRVATKKLIFEFWGDSIMHLTRRNGYESNDVPKRIWAEPEDNDSESR